MNFNIVGEKITHKTLGDGTILSFDGIDLEIAFNDGVKKLKYDYVIKNRLIDFNNQNAQHNVYGRLVEDDEYSGIPDDLANIMAKKKLLAKLHEFGFEGFLHTTEFTNFKKIVSSGYLYSRSLLGLADQDFYDSADNDVVNHTKDYIKKCCRFYYYFKTPTNYKANYNNPVILVFDENLIYYEDCKFSPQNAAKRYNIITSNAEEALEFPWDGIFERGNIFCSKYYSLGNELSQEYVIGIRNAEFLFPYEISIDKITKIYFKYEYSMQQAKDFCPPELINKFCLDRSKFCIKND